MFATGFKPARNSVRPLGRAAGRALVMSTLVGGILIGGVGGATSAFADTTPGTQAGEHEVGVAASERHIIHNDSSHWLRLVDIRGDKKFEGAPEVRSTVPPGGGQVVEVKGVGSDDFIYDVLDNHDTAIGTFTAHLEEHGPYSNGKVWMDSCSTTIAQAECSATQKSVTLLDKSGSSVTVAADTPWGDEALERYCGNGMQLNLNCTFTATSRDAEAYGPQHVMGPKVFNNTDNKENWTEYKFSVSQSATHSWAVSPSAEIQLTKAIKLGISTTTTTGTSDTITREQTLHLNCPSYTLNWVESRDPVVRYTGDFTFRLGNTTWKVTGATYDAPDISRAPVQVQQSRPMTDQEKHDLTPTVQVLL